MMTKIPNDAVKATDIVEHYLTRAYTDIRKAGFIVTTEMVAIYIQAAVQTTEQIRLSRREK